MSDPPATAPADPLSAGTALPEIPVFTEFEGVADPARYRPLPDDWLLALGDVVGSTAAIADGRYKAVNTAGAAVISALVNALGRYDLPFVFGGDGGSLALPAAGAARAAEALAALCRWTQEEMGIEMRAALVPVAAIRAAGLDLRVARFRASDQVGFAMFAGGGAAWAEAEMKRGRFAVPPGPPGSQPDLTGLSCRWDVVPARKDGIVSLLILPGPGPRAAGPDMERGTEAEFAALVAAVLAIAGEDLRAGHPIPAEGPPLRFSLSGFVAEARMQRGTAARLRTGLKAALSSLLIAALHLFGLTIGRFDPRRYRRDVAMNSDFRKFDDGLKMTLDLSSAQLARIEALVRRAAAGGICRFGLYRQKAALVTCIVPTPLARDHMHFVDGASGGYAEAARQVKAAGAPDGNGLAPAGAGGQG